MKIPFAPPAEIRLYPVGDSSSRGMRWRGGTARLAASHFRDALRMEGEMGYNNVLVPLDGSEVARAALDELKKLVRPGEGTVVLLSVIDTPPMQLEGYGEVLGTLDIQERLRVKYEAILESEAVELRAGGFLVRTLVRDGLAHEQIVIVCREEKIDLLVMTTHGRSGLAHWIMGSVTERVVRSAPCPVLIVRKSGGGS